jgi:EPS-associated MarR family transcriptional regulator
MNPSIKNDEIYLQVLRTIEARPEQTQRQLAEELGVSLGKAHYCIKATIDKGLVKMGNFSHNQKRLDFAHLLTPSGIKSKAILTAHFIERKSAEYAMLKSEKENHKKQIKRLEQSNSLKNVEKVLNEHFSQSRDQ